MFERYTQKARRVVFFARYEASQFGSPYIETEHLLLGLLREDKVLTNRFLRSYAAVEAIRQQIESRTAHREKVSVSVDLSLSKESARVLAYASEEAERLAHKHIGTWHLMLGLVREEKSFAADILREQGLRLSNVREELARMDVDSLEQSSPTLPISSMVTIGSTPTGADIEVDGAFLGNTPAEVPLAVGERVVRITKKGYKPWERTLQVLPRGKQTITAELEQLPQINAAD
jgi:ATP-dependent Clp protease ATP-binding subunit ClpA